MIIPSYLRELECFIFELSHSSVAVSTEATVDVDGSLRHLPTTRCRHGDGRRCRRQPAVASAVSSTSDDESAVFTKRPTLSRSRSVSSVVSPSWRNCRSRRQPPRAAETRRRPARRDVVSAVRNEVFIAKTVGEPAIIRRSDVLADCRPNWLNAGTSCRKPFAEQCCRDELLMPSGSIDDFESDAEEEIAAIDAAEKSGAWPPVARSTSWFRPDERD